MNVPRIDVPTYMPWLFARFQQLGGTVHRKEIGALDELTQRLSHRGQLCWAGGA